MTIISESFPWLHILSGSDAITSVHNKILGLNSKDLVSDRFMFYFVPQFWGIYSSAKGSPYTVVFLLLNNKSNVLFYFVLIDIRSIFCSREPICWINTIIIKSKFVIKILSNFNVVKLKILVHKIIISSSCSHNSFSS